MSILHKGHSFVLFGRYLGRSMKQETIIQALMESTTSVSYQTSSLFDCCVYSERLVSSCVMYYTINNVNLTYVNSAWFIIVSGRVDIYWHQSSMFV